MNMNEFYNKTFHALYSDRKNTKKILKIFGDIRDPENTINNYIKNNFLFEILDSDLNKITKIKKKGSGEIFEIGCDFYDLASNKWVKDIYFDDFLIGNVYGDTIYNNFVRSGEDNKIYHISLISLRKPIKTVKSDDTYDDKTKCFIMHDTKLDAYFVLLDEKQAFDLYKNGDYIMMESQIINNL